MDTTNPTDGAGQTNIPPQTTPTTPTPPTPTTPEKNTGTAMIAYLGILVIIPLLTESKNDPFVKFHIKQGLVLLICFFIASALVMVPLLGAFLSPLAWLGCLILMVLGIIHASNGKQEDLPVIGQFAKNFHF